MPEDAADRAATDWLGVLLHELAHYLRRDHLADLMAHLLLCAVPWQPLAWIAHRRLRQLAEGACDDWALARGAAPASYAQSLLGFLPQRGAGAVLAAVSSRSNLAQRVRSILSDRVRHPRLGRGPAMATGALAVSLIAAMAFAQARAQTPAAPDAPGSPGSAAPKKEATVAVPLPEEAPPAAAPNDPGLSILCVDAQGKPVAGADVYLMEVAIRSLATPPKPTALGPLHAGADGIVRPPNIPMQYRNVLGWTHTVYARAPGRLAGIACSRHAPIKVVLAPAVKVDGSVSVPAGYDATRVVVRLMCYDRQGITSQDRVMWDRIGLARNLWPEIFETHADAQGHFTLRDMPSGGRLYLAAEGPGLGQTQLTSEDATKLAQIKMDLVPEGVCEGTLTYKDTGNPASGVTIQAEPQDGVCLEPFEGITDAQGHYRITGLARPMTPVIPGAVDRSNMYNIALPITGEHDQWRMLIRELRVDSGQTVKNVNLQLERGAELSGLVVDAETHKPVANAIIAASVPLEFDDTMVDCGATDRDGRYHLRLPEGNLIVYVMGASVPEAFSPSDERHRFVNVAPGQTHLDDINFTIGADGISRHVQTAFDKLDETLRDLKLSGVGGQSRSR